MIWNLLLGVLIVGALTDDLKMAGARNVCTCLYQKNTQRRIDNKEDSSSKVERSVKSKGDEEEDISHYSDGDEEHPQQRQKSNVKYKIIKVVKHVPVIKHIPVIQHIRVVTYDSQESTDDDDDDGEFDPNPEKVDETLEKFPRDTNAYGGSSPGLTNIDSDVLAGKAFRSSANTEWSPLVKDNNNEGYYKKLSSKDIKKIKNLLSENGWKTFMPHENIQSDESSEKSTDAPGSKENQPQNTEVDESDWAGKKQMVKTYNKVYEENQMKLYQNNRTPFRHVSRVVKRKNGGNVKWMRKNTSVNVNDQLWHQKEERPVSIGKVNLGSFGGYDEEVNQDGATYVSNQNQIGFQDPLKHHMTHTRNYHHHDKDVSRPLEFRNNRSYGNSVTRGWVGLNKVNGLPDHPNHIRPNNNYYKSFSKSMNVNVNGQPWNPKQIRPDFRFVKRNRNRRKGGVVWKLISNGLPRFRG